MTAERGVAMTQALYYENPPILRWTTEIIERREREGRVHVVLAETAFYPEGGGQPADGGTIAGLAVEMVYQEDAKVFHVLERDPGQGQVQCEVDSERRWHHMQHHSGQHLLSAVWESDYQCQTIGFHLGERYATIDLTGPELEAGWLAAVERRVNRKIHEDLPIVTHSLPSHELKNYSIRGGDDFVGPVRLVQIADLDDSPCCGTHVTSTGQIGLVKLLKTERVRGCTRIYFVCGMKALEDYQAKDQIVRALCARYSTGEADLLQRIEGDERRLQELTREHRELRQLWLTLQAQTWAVGKRIVEADVCEPDDASVLAKAILDAGAEVAVVRCGQRLFVQHNGDLDWHFGQFIRSEGVKFGGRGGGSGSAAQAYFHDPEQLEHFAAHLKSALEGSDDE